MPGEARFEVYRLQFAAVLASHGPAQTTGEAQEGRPLVSMLLSTLPWQRMSNWAALLGGPSLPPAFLSPPPDSPPLAGLSPAAACGSSSTRCRCAWTQQRAAPFWRRCAALWPRASPATTAAATSWPPAASPTPQPWRRGGTRCCGCGACTTG
jgi:hypothetical protein